MQPPSPRSEQLLSQAKKIAQLAHLQKDVVMGGGKVIVDGIGDREFGRQEKGSVRVRNGIRGVRPSDHLVCFAFCSHSSLQTVSCCSKPAVCRTTPGNLRPRLRT